ncbi:MAG: carboxylating nicotinate-nucleotide diphosphorylase [Methanobacteriaceae archaeon]
MDIIEYMVDEDIGFGDITSSALIDKNKTSKAYVIPKEDGIIAGIGVAKLIFEKGSLNVSELKSDSDIVASGEKILEINGNTQDILKLERTALNMMMRMSGIATLTNKLVQKASEYGIRVAGTRKTTPGIQKFEKQAISIGGGDTHRLRLDDCVMIKDNHIAAVGDLVKAINLAKKNISFTKKIEVEVETLDDALKAANEGVDILMLDNMSPNNIIATIDALKNAKLRENLIIEASGGINESNFSSYLINDLDIISLGIISHSAPSLDISLDIIN